MLGGFGAGRGAEPDEASDTAVVCGAFFVAVLVMTPGFLLGVALGWVIWA